MECLSIVLNFCPTYYARAKLVSNMKILLIGSESSHQNTLKTARNVLLRKLSIKILFCTGRSCPVILQHKSCDKSILLISSLKHLPHSVLILPLHIRFIHVFQSEIQTPFIQWIFYSVEALSAEQVWTRCCTECPGARASTVTGSSPQYYKTKTTDYFYLWISLSLLYCFKQIKGELNQCHDFVLNI